jgi:hypothetical protein
MSVYKPKPSSHEGRLYRLGNGVNSIKPPRPKKPLPNQQNLLEIRDKSK